MKGTLLVRDVCIWMDTRRGPLTTIFVDLSLVYTHLQPWLFIGFDGVITTL